MASLEIVVLPLRIPYPEQHDVAQMVARCIDEQTCDGIPSSRSCRADLDRMFVLRAHLASKMDANPTNYQGAFDCWEDLHEYYNFLLDCEARGITGQHNSNTNHPTLQICWESALHNNNTEVQVFTTLEMERANWIWNIAVLEAYQASQQKLDCKVGWSKAAQHFQNAASWLNQIPPSQECVEFSETFLKFWQALLMAQSQRCVYESLACAPRPRNLLLAKLAAAAVPLYGEMEAILQADEDSAHPLLTASDNHPYITNTWADYSRAWGMFMNCKAEHHQAMTCREKKQWGQELARLDLAFQFATLCLEYCERAPVRELHSLHVLADNTVQDLQQRLHEASLDNDTTHHQPVPERQTLTEIRGETLVNLNQPMNKLLKPLRGEPLFQNLVAVEDDDDDDEPDQQQFEEQHYQQQLQHPNQQQMQQEQLQSYMDLFHSDMDKRVFQMQSVADERTESAKKALASANLPHSLTLYKQERSGGGIPQDLWQRVETIQREHRLAKIKQELWELRDVAEMARTTYQRIHTQLDFDLDSDRLFRQQNPGFEGHDTEEVQRSFRQSLSNFDRLLVTAQEGDSVLLKRLEILDTNPKYKLLQFQKSQLDRLLPGPANGGGGSGGGGCEIETTHLSRLMDELNHLFRDREALLNTMQEEVRNYDIQGALEDEARQGGSDAEYREVIKYAKKSFDEIVYEMQNNIEQQTGLVNSIMHMNDQFVMARERQQRGHNHHAGQSASGGGGDTSCIVMIEDAIDEIELLTKHLKEGRDFYDVVLPKLDKLQMQVGDVSARLTVERLEYDDKADRNRQLEEDAKMAKEISAKSTQSNSNSGQPGMSQVHHQHPNGRGGGTYVDDEKVATLVAMEFDPDKVVAALSKHNNNVDQALNDLLSC